MKRTCIALILFGIIGFISSCSNPAIIYGTIEKNSLGESIYIYPQTVDGELAESLDTIVTYAPCQPIVVPKGKHKVKFKVINIDTKQEKEEIIDFNFSQNKKLSPKLISGKIELRETP
mgnify:CR=1 FL=1